MRFAMRWLLWYLGTALATGLFLWIMDPRIAKVEHGPFTYIAGGLALANFVTPIAYQISASLSRRAAARHAAIESE